VNLPDREREIESSPPSDGFFLVDRVCKNFFHRNLITREDSLKAAKNTRLEAGKKPTSTPVAAMC
jgi:hypothetical protein